MPDHRSLGAPGQGFDRRSILKLGAGGALALGFLGSLTACGDSSEAGTSAAGAAGTPQKGGTLRVGLTGGGTSDTLDPQAMTLITDIARKYALFDQLVETDATGKSELRLAKSITPNSNATEWKVVIRPDVKFHDGTPLTADVIMWNFNRIVKNKLAAQSALGPINLGKSKVVDDTTLTLHFDSPYSQLIDNLAVYNFGVVPKNFDPKKPVGTGPFKFQSFTPGKDSTFVRNDDYWVAGLPYLDSLVITDVADETTQMSGLQAGQFDCVGFLSAASVNTAKSAGFNVVISDSGGFVPYIMKTDEPPFNDPQVREAFKYIVDRDQVAQQVYGGYGKIGNDVTSPYDPAYDTALPQRTQDIAKAKQLLAAAGQEGMSIDLYTSTGAGPGAVALAQVFAEQAGAAGVKVKVIQQDTTQYFSDTYKKVPFSMEYWQYLPYMAQAGQSYLPVSPWNSTFRDDPDYNQMYSKASAIADPEQKKPVIQDMMKFDYDQGGYIIPVFMPVMDAWASNVGGVGKSVTAVTPGGASWAHYWIKS